jgi:hypothetical protein
MTEEFGRMKSAIADPTNPLKSVEVRVDTEASLAFWESLLKDQGIPGRVVVGGKPGAAVPDLLTVKAPTPGFWRSNAGALGTSAGLSALSSAGETVIRIAEQMAMGDVTNEESDPEVALAQVRYLRERFNEPRGVTYALWTAITGEIKEHNRQQRLGNQWLNQVEQYWTERQKFIESNSAAIRANLPPRGAVSALPR